LPIIIITTLSCFIPQNRIVVATDCFASSLATFLFSPQQASSAYFVPVKLALKQTPQSLPNQFSGNLRYLPRQYFCGGYFLCGWMYEKWTERSERSQNEHHYPVVGNNQRRKESNMGFLIFAASSHIDHILSAWDVN
jgi:hypothetical protein